MSSSSDKQQDKTEGNGRLYRFGCLILTLICLVLLLVVIVLCVKRECLQPWIWIPVSATKTNNCCLDYVVKIYADYLRIAVFFCTSSAEVIEYVSAIIITLFWSIITDDSGVKRIHCSLWAFHFPHIPSHCGLISSSSWIHGLPWESGQSNRQSRKQLSFSNLQLQAMPDSLHQHSGQTWGYSQNETVQNNAILKLNHLDHL